MVIVAEVEPTATSETQDAPKTTSARFNLFLIFTPILSRSSAQGEATPTIKIPGQNAPGKEYDGAGM
jgi:hypothetical protein